MKTRMGKTAGADIHETGIVVSSSIKKLNITPGRKDLKPEKAQGAGLLQRDVIGFENLCVLPGGFELLQVV